MTVQPDDNMKAEIDYDGAFERVWIDNDGTLRDYDKSLEIGCAPVVKQRDELLAEVEKFGEYVESVGSAQQRAGRAEQLARELLAALIDLNNLYMPDPYRDELIRRATEQLGETT